MKNLLKYSFALLSLPLLFGSCRKEPNFPDEPNIEFRRVEQFTIIEPSGRKQDELILVVGYQDGDGDLGLSKATDSPDRQPPFHSGSPYEHNFVADLQVKKDGAYIPYPFTGQLSFSGRFPRLSDDERNEALEGEIRYTIDSFASDTWNLSGTLTDTIRFQIYIYDRALNKSNTILTDDIILFKGQPR